MGNLGLHKLQCQRFYKKLHVTVFVHTIDMFILYHVVCGSLIEVVLITAVWDSCSIMMCTCVVFLQLVAFYRQGNRLPPSPLCPPEVLDIIKKCWEYQAADRPSFSDLSTEILRARLNIEM